MSTSKTFLPLAALLTQENRGLPRLLQQAQRLQELTQTLVEALPPSVGEHCRVGNVASDTLTLVTDSPAWSTRLRFYTPAILAHFRQRHGLDLRSVRVRVRPPETPREASHPVSRRITLSPHSAEIIKQTALGISDPDLKRALLRLAHRSPEKD